MNLNGFEGKDIGLFVGRNIKETIMTSLALCMAFWHEILRLNETKNEEMLLNF